MAKYTTTIKTLQEINYDLGLNDYPIFDAAYRAALNTKILDHFRFREIGFETPALFKWFLNVKMREEMPLFNQYYLNALIQFNPLYAVNLTESSKKETAGASASDGTSSSETASDTNTRNKDVSSDTPQGLLYLDEIEDPVNRYASRADIASSEAGSTGTGSSTAHSENTITNVDDYLKTIVGSNGAKSQSELVIEHRKTFLNVDMMVIAALEELFMAVW